VHRGVANFLDFRIEKKSDLYRLFQLQIERGKLKTETENEVASFNGYYFWIMKNLKAYSAAVHN
jgi:hypothetical protein